MIQGPGLGPGSYIVNNAAENANVFRVAQSITRKLEISLSFFFVTNLVPK
jgi:hypothetical protein